MSYSHEHWMNVALQEADKAAKKNEVPIGAVVVVDDNVIGRGFNQRETTGLSTAHAEIEAIRGACQSVGDWRLDGATIVITMEPCLMCFGAIVQSRIKTVIYGCNNDKNPDYLREIYRQWPNGPQMVGGVEQQRCVDALSAFFAELRGA